MEVIMRFFLTTKEQVGVVLTRLGDLVFLLDKISCLAVLRYFASSAGANSCRLADDLGRENRIFNPTPHAKGESGRKLFSQEANRIIKSSSAQRVRPSAEGTKRP
jgi:hypothetical protein